MRTTLTIESDVAVRLDRLRKERNLTLKEAVNTALREGLEQLDAPSPPVAQFSTRTVDLGVCRINRLDDVAEALALAEGEDFK